KNGDYLPLDRLCEATGLEGGQNLREVLAAAEREGLLLIDRGAAPAITDLMGGTVDMLITSPASAEPMVAAGKLRILALSHENGIGIFKGAPTLGQSGMDGITADDWYGLFAPAGTPPERVA
ncbi:tripartite tricarboxylate transporter substrate-binding protein, partial [Escherichia coli]|uniref:tripartite tricarboxylate transporter substrate-binding protein n=1 Tax=Escherichia coli TaxID=562 RepID=UPI00228068D4